MRTLYPLGVLAVALACTSPLDVPTSELPLVETDLAFEFDADDPNDLAEPISYRFTNRTRTTLYLQTHCAIVLEAETGSGAWERVWGAEECLAVQQRAIRVGPGEHYENDVKPRNVEGAVPGGYRLRFLAVSDELISAVELGASIPEALRRSNRFSIR
ncbi:MAG: hypothetical protein AAF389_04550 [Gemmatimonadota bacterium]